MKLSLAIICALLILSVGCEMGKGSGIQIDEPYDPPELQSQYCPVMDNWYIVTDCTNCHK